MRHDTVECRAMIRRVLGVPLLAAAGCGDHAGPGAAPVVTTSAVAVGRSPAASPVSTLPAPAAAFEVRSRKVVSGPRTLEVTLGTTVVLEVLIDAVDELHVHGYERTVAVEPGAPVRIEFAATIPGVFEVELHSGVRLCALQVR